MEPRPTIRTPNDEDNDTRWLAMLIRRALLLVVAGIEARYGIMGSRERG